MLLNEQEIMDINQNAEFDSAIGYARAIESAVLEKLKAQEPALVRYNKHMNGEVEPDPVERLRFFLSLALTGQNWFDVEKFLDDLPPDDVVRDAERLDWLINSGRMVICDKEGCYTYTHTSGRYGPVAKTQREAIDAAMKEMK